MKRTRQTDKAPPQPAAVEGAPPADHAEAMKPLEETLPPFALSTGQQLRRKDGSYLEVVANASIKGVANVILQSHAADGSRAPHPQDHRFNAGHGAVPLAEVEAAIAAGEYTLAHAPA